MPIRLLSSSSEAPTRPQPHEHASSAERIGLYRSAQVRVIEIRAAHGLPVGTLMQRAGASVAALARALKPHARRMLVLAGPGNNGGDGFEAAWRLKQAGVAVSVVWLGDEDLLPADASDALARARAAGVAISPARPGGPGSSAERASWAGLGRADLVIDALLGRGLGRPASGAMGQLIDTLNHQAADVLAVDLPSGLPGDTGCLGSTPHGDPAATRCVRARWTLALLSPAPGLWMAQGRDHAGEIWFDDLGVAIGAPGDPAPAAWLSRGAGQFGLPRQHAGHKGSYGDVWIVGGASGMLGAATLAARAALNSGAGRVHLRALAPDAPPLDLLTPELMCHPVAGPQAASPAAETLARATVVAGCGGGSAITALLAELIDHSARLVLDADALNGVAADAWLRAALQARGAAGRASVLTPHPLEAARLLGCDAARVQGDRLAAAQTLADQLQCCVVLKGSGSVIAAPGCTPCINPSGNAALATAGSGDVLAGWLGGLWSQCADPLVAGYVRHRVPRPAPVAPPDGSSQGGADPVDWAALQTLAAQAVWSHGHTAELASPTAQALPASQLVQLLGEHLKAQQL
jgi:hydroxyethylthiazole kinase-like uncharacterized protein yjeF